MNDEDLTDPIQRRGGNLAELIAELDDYDLVRYISYWEMRFRNYRSPA